MSIKAVVIQKGKIGANILNKHDGISAFMFTGIEIAGKFEYGEVYKIQTLDEAALLGIDADYDKTNNVRIYRHISEFFRLAGEGQTLYLTLAAQTVSMADLLDITGSYAQNLIIQAGGNIRLIGVSINPADTYIATILDGINADVHAAIPKAQEFSDWAFETNRQVNVFLEGRDYTGPQAAALDLRAIPTTDAPNVSLIIGQDYDYAETQNSVGQKFADIGTFLGALSKIKVNENPGEVETMNLTDSKRNVWMQAGLSSHVKIEDVEADLEPLDGKGYVFAYTDVNFEGFRWNDDHTCVEIREDVDGNINESQISYGRTLGKAVRLLRAALIGKVKSVQPLDATGKLPPGIVKYLEGIGDDALATMERNAEISAGKTTVDKDSDLITPPKELKVSFNILPYGTIALISGTINIKKQL